MEVKCLSVKYREVRELIIFQLRLDIFSFAVHMDIYNINISYFGKKIEKNVILLQREFSFFFFVYAYV